jgi:mono/diheme cytochrome c family protein
LLLLRSSRQETPMSLKKALVIGAFVAVAGCAAGRAGPAGPRVARLHWVFEPKIDCYRCHDGAGHGTGHGPNLTGAVPKLDDARLVHVIDHGSVFMPAYGVKISDQERRELVVWLLKAFGGPPACTYAR